MKANSKDCVAGLAPVILLVGASCALYISPFFTARAQPPIQPPVRPVKPEVELEMLRLQVAQQEKELKQLRRLGMHYGVGARALRAPLGRFVLAKDGTRCLAIQIIEHGDTGVAGKIGHTSTYRWFLQTDGSMDFSKANVQQGQDELSELDEKNGSHLIRQGPFSLQWSLSDWIYFPTGTPKFQLAVTDWVSPEEIKVQQANWYSAMRIE